MADNPYNQFDKASQAAGDLFTVFGQGSNGLLQAAGDFYGLIANDMDNPVSRQARETNEYLERRKSPELVAAQKDRKTATDAEANPLVGALTYIRKTVSNPLLALTSTVEALPSLVGAGGVGIGAKAVASKLLAKQATKRAAGIGVGAAVAAGAGQQGASVGGDQYRDVVETLNKIPDEVALELPQIRMLMEERDASLAEAKAALAIDLGRTTGLLAGAASVGTQMIPGGRTIERAFVEPASKRGLGRLAGAAAGAFGETLQEAAEGGIGQIIQNINATAVDPKRDLTKGLGEAIGSSVGVTATAGVAGSGAGRSQSKVDRDNAVVSKFLAENPEQETSVTDATKQALSDVPNVNLSQSEKLSSEQFWAAVNVRHAAALGGAPSPQDVAVTGETAAEQSPFPAENAEAITAGQTAVEIWRESNPDSPENITVIFDPGMLHNGYGVQGAFNPQNGGILINMAFVAPERVSSIVNHEWAHATLASKEGRQAMADFAQDALGRVDLKGLEKQYGKQDPIVLLEEWIAKNQEEAPGVIREIVARIREWLSQFRISKVKLSDAEIADIMLRTLREAADNKIQPDIDFTASPETVGASTVEDNRFSLSEEKQRPASGIMASPSIVDINYERAKKNLSSADQARFKSQITEFAPGASIYDAVGDWLDGAEPTVAAVFDTSLSVEDLQILAAKAGLAGYQKAVLWWRTDPDGADAIHRINWPKSISMDQARQALIDVGLENRTLIETPDGIQGFVFDPKKQDLNKIESLYEHSTQPTFASDTATGVFLGSNKNRVEGRQAYRRILGSAAQTRAQNEGGGRPDERTSGEPQTRFSLAEERSNVLASPGVQRDRSGRETGDRLLREKAGRLSPLRGAPIKKDATGPDPRIVDVAERYAAAHGIDFKRQAEYVKADPAFGARVAQAYEDMPHAPNDPKVREAYENMARQLRDQYDALVDAGYKFYFYDSTNDPYGGNPFNAVRDLRANQRMAVYTSEEGFGSGAEFDPKGNPLLTDTGLKWGFGSENGPSRRVLINDLFRAVHDALGHGMEGAGFREDGEENAWQAHQRLFTGSAVGAMTSETRGQNSWLNFGPMGAKNKTAKVQDTVFADQKTGLMPEWTWTENVAPDETETGSEEPKLTLASETPSAGPTDERSNVLSKKPIGESASDAETPQTRFSLTQTKTPEFKAWFGDSKVVDAEGKPLVVYHGTKNQDFSKFNVSSGYEYGPGAYFASDSDRATRYAGASRAIAYAEEGANTDTISAEFPRGNSARIIPVFVSIKNPIFTDEFDNLPGETNNERNQEARRRGYDGVIKLWGNGEIVEVVAFNPNQIKSATGNTGAFDPKNEDIRFSLTPQKKPLAAPAAEPFFSKLTQTIATLPQEILTVQQARALIEKGSKKAEVEQQGLLTDPLSPLYAKQPGDKVTRKELLDYSTERAAKVQDVVLGQPMFSKESLARFGKLSAREDNGLTRAEELRMYTLSEEGDIEGTEEYNELSERLTNNGLTNAEQIELKELRAQGEQEQATEFSSYQLPGADEESYREMFVTWPKPSLNEAYKRAYKTLGLDPLSRPLTPWELAKADAIATYGPQWRDGHGAYSDITNPIVRIRRNIRTDADGRKTYFIEEIQGPNPANQEKMPDYLRKRIYEIGMKRALRDAVDEGADAIAWTTGDQQAERYDLSKQIDRLEYGGNSEELIGYKDGQQVLRENVPSDRIEEYVGKDAAKKIADQINEKPNELATLEGDDLRVGGHGLRNLYDRTLPSIANDLAKKFGGRVGTASIEDVKNLRKYISSYSAWLEFVDPDGLTSREAFDAMSESEKLSMVPRDADRETKTVHSLPIPAALKQQQRTQGNPIFSLTSDLQPYLTTTGPVKTDRKGFVPGFITANHGLATVVGGKNKSVDVPVISFDQYADRKFKVAVPGPYKGGNYTLAETHVPTIQASYPGLSRETIMEKDPRKAAGMIVSDMSENLLFLHDLAVELYGQQIANRMTHWYDGAKVISRNFAEKFNISEPQAAAVLATQSPQRNWFANVSLAENIMDVQKNHQDTVFDAAIEKFAREFIKNSTGTTSSKRVLYDNIREISGKKLSELDDPDQQAVFTRFLSQKIHPKKAYVVTPEGALSPNSSVTIAWGGIPTVRNSIKAFNSPEADSLSEAIGQGHKVRNFYGNIIDPDSPVFFTSDTHNVSAALMSPLGGTDPLVLHNFGGNPTIASGEPRLPVLGSLITGLQGTYPFYQEAGNVAAKARGLLPRQMQSITWETVRALFTDEAKRSELPKLVEQVHAKVRDGSITVPQAREQIIELAGGREAIKSRIPEWATHDTK